MSDSNVPVLESVRAAIEFARYSVPRVIGVLALVLLLHVISLQGGKSGVGVVVSLISPLLGIVAYGALFRLAFADEHPADPDFRIGFMGFQWGRAETNLLGALLLLSFLALLGILLWVLLAICFGATAMVLGVSSAVPLPNATPDAAKAAFGAVTLAFLAAAVWVAVRVCLFSAATVAEKRIMVFSTWRLTKGQFWRIFAATLIVMAPALVLTVALVSGALSPAATLWAFIAFSVVNGFGVLPALCGLYAFLYRGLRPAGLAGTAA